MLIKTVRAPANVTLETLNISRYCRQKYIKRLHAIRF
jgi:hypothetical protein